MAEALVILPDDPRAARLVTNLSGWVDRHGQFFGDDEDLARYAGSTHSACKECGEVTSKGWLQCTKCRLRKDIAKYETYPKQEYTGDIVYSDARDEFYLDEDELLDALVDGATCESLRIVACEPQYAHYIDAEDFFHDSLPEDGEVPDELEKIVTAANEAIKAYGKPLSWVPANIAITYTRKSDAT